MLNPIPAKFRGVIYIIGIIIGGLALIATAVLEVADMEKYNTVVTAVVSATTLVTGILARANLDSPEEPR